MLARAPVRREVDQTWSFRGSKSRNKVSVGEPAEGSLQKLNTWGTDSPFGARGLTPFVTNFQPLVNL